MDTPFLGRFEFERVVSRSARLTPRIPTRWPDRGTHPNWWRGYGPGVRWRSLWAHIDALTPSLRFVVATLAVSLCVGLGYVGGQHVAGTASSLLYLSVAVAALVGGHPTGLFATGIGAAVTLMRLLGPSADLVTPSEAYLNTVVFTVTGVLMSFAGTALRDARLRAHRTEERLHLMADNAPVLIWTANADKSITWLNRRWLEFTGRTLEQDQGSGWLHNVHPADLPACLATYEQAFDTQEQFELEYRLRRRDGEYRWVVDRGVPIVDEDGHFAGFIGSCIDIHERRQAAEEREFLLDSERAARAEAEHANQLKEEFLSIVSHELRAPLNAIVGWTHLLREQIADRPECASALAIIDRNARAQTRIVDDLLDMSRLMAGRLLFKRDRVNLVDVVRDAITAVDAPVRNRQLQLTTSLPEKAVYVDGDEHRLHQAVWHLLANAVKFTSPGGSISVHLTTTPASASITVADTGRGIAPEFLPYVFERFQQADSSRTRRHGGLGLGLTLVRAIVQQHGGQVSADSAGTGRGATFTIEVPTARSGGALSHAETERPLQSVDVLVVDDDADTCELLRRILEECGARVRTSTSAQSALEQWESAPPHVLVSDISMPERDGYSLVREIRRRPDAAGGHVPAIALTAFGRPEDQRAALDAGFQAHMRKPVEPADLVTTISELVRA